MLKQHLKRQGGLLSGGQQQQLASARGLMCNHQRLNTDASENFTDYKQIQKWWEVVMNAYLY